MHDKLEGRVRESADGLRSRRHNNEAERQRTEAQVRERNAREMEEEDRESDRRK